MALYRILVALGNRHQTCPGVRASRSCSCSGRMLLSACVIRVVRWVINTAVTSCNPTLPLEFYIHRSGYLPSRELRLSATRPRPRRRTGSQHLSVARRKTRGVQEFRPHLHLPWAALKQVLERAGLHAYARHDISCRFCAPYRL